jgi:hypothetical protein
MTSLAIMMRVAVEIRNVSMADAQFQIFNAKIAMIAMMTRNALMMNVLLIQTKCPIVKAVKWIQGIN